MTNVKKRTVCVVTRWLGERSEVWVWRQLMLFSHTQPVVFTWTRKNAADYPMGDISVHLAGTPEDPQLGYGRWLWRLRNLVSGNFFGTQGTEKNRIVEVLHENQVSAVLCHFGQSALRLLPACEAADIPIVAHFHGQDISSGLNNRWYRWSLKKMLPRFAAVVCVGSQQMQRLRDLGVPADRLHLVPCGAPSACFPLSRRCPDPKSTTYICVSRLVESKGVAHCIGAFALAAEKLAGSQLIVVGDGDVRDSLETLVRELGISASVHFAGSCSEEEVRSLLKKSDVFLQHSLDHSSGWFEGFGVAVAEAASIGLPVIVSACGGLMDQVVHGETGIIIPQKDEEAMADAMVQLGRDAQLRAWMGDNGRQRMLVHFDTTTQVEKLERVLLSVIEGHTRN